MDYLTIKKEIESKFPLARLIAVSKLQPVERILELYNNGQRAFAENYAQEFFEKQSLLPQDIRWHFIGHLQTNKLKFIIGKVDTIHSVDSLRLASEIDKMASKLNLKQNILIQINVSQEDSKSGYSEELFWKEIDQLTSLKNIQISGLMTMPPLQNEPEQNVIYFQKCSEILKRLHSLGKISQNCNELSMGTSSDYLVALNEGATMVRLGTILFGERPKK